MKIDVHSMYVEEAMDLILKQIELCVKYNDNTLEVVHGFNKGSAIKSRVLKLTSKNHPAIIRARSHIFNPGITIIDIRVNLI